MRRSGGRRSVEWAGPGTAEPPEGRPQGRLGAIVRTFADGWPAASSIARAVGIILLVSTVFIVVLGSIETGNLPVETVKMPSLVRTARPTPEPEAKTVPIRRPPPNFARWLSPATDFRQVFSEESPGTPDDLCRRLAELGYSRAGWSESRLFRGEWECSSDLDAGADEGRSFVLIRGADENTVSSLMLKLIAPEETGRDDLIGKAENVVATFSDATGLALSPAAMPLLTGWQAGQTWTSRGSFRVAAEAGKNTVRIVSLSVTPPLPRPAGDACGEACRARAAVLAKEGGARRVKTDLRTIR